MAEDRTAEPMSLEDIQAWAETVPERRNGPLWSLLDWSFWGAGMGDVLREPLADVMLAAAPARVTAHAEAVMAEFIERRKIKKTGVTIYQEQAAETERLRAELADLAEQVRRVRARHVGQCGGVCASVPCECEPGDLVCAECETPFPCGTVIDLDGEEVSGR